MIQELHPDSSGHPPPPEPLEDEAEDILGKAARGLGLDFAVPEDDAELVDTADEFGLDPLRLLAIAHGRYQPRVISPPGIARFTTRYARLDMDVNAYLAFDPASRNAVAFDTGADATPVIDFVTGNGLKLSALLVTHTHPDHIADLVRFRGFSIPVFSPAGEPLPDSETIQPGDTLTFGNLNIEARLTSGHSPGGLTFVVHGLPTPVAVVGDALFAGSIGGPNISYQDALDHLNTQVFSLPPETVLCPGHGPLTTVGLERDHNPFFPAKP